VSFSGTERFEVMRPLGKGGMGQVYEAFDKRRQLSLALKVLQRESITGISQLKREFRAIAGLQHPHLIKLYDLYVDPQRVFFTMELVRGQELRQYLLGSLFVVHKETVSDEEDTQLVSENRPGTRNTRITPPLQDDGIQRLLPILPQLLGALDLLHRNKKVHRDLKPQNVIIDNKGILKLIDFGLLTHQGQSEGEELQGTPTYMAPEVIAGGEVTGAADMYSLGVMLYELFGGRPPFYGNTSEILQGHQQKEPTPLDLMAPRAEWEPLIFSLLSKDPSARPSAAELASKLEERFGRQSFRVIKKVNQEPLFVGRTKEKQLILDAAREVAQSGARGIILSGVSGCGKTALSREVALSLEREGWQYFSSRCFEREAVPFRAFDALLDELAYDLAGRKNIPMTGISARSKHALLHLFPVLSQIENLRESAVPSALDADPNTLRRTGMRAFAALLREIARERPMVIELNDLQWIDKDSAELFSCLFEAKPSVLFIGTTWEDGTAEGGALLPLLQEYPSPQMRTLRLGPLSFNELREMAQMAGAEVSNPILMRIYQEASSSPYWAWELLQSAKGERTLTLGKILSQKLDSLGATARSALEIVAAVGSRTSFSLIEKTSLLPAEELSRSLDELVRFRLLREAHSADGEDGYVPYHERTRLRVYETIPPEKQQELHAEIASNMELLGEAERAPGTCAEHWHLAGDDAKASVLALQAAKMARSTLALELAAELFSRAAQWSSDENLQAEAEAGMGEVLDKLGRGEEASACFLSASSRKQGEESAQLKVLSLDAGLRATDSIDYALKARELTEQLEQETEPWGADLALKAYAAFAQTTSIAFLSRDVDLAERYFEFAEISGKPSHQGVSRIIAAYVLSQRGDDNSRRLAVRFLEEVSSLLGAYEDPIAPALRGLAWGQLRLASGEHLAATGAFAEVIKLLKEKGHTTSRLLALAAAGQGKSLILQGNVKGARAVLEPLLHATARPELRASHLHIITTLAPLWGLLGEANEALALLSETNRWTSMPGVRLAFSARLAFAEINLFLSRPTRAREYLQPLWDEAAQWGVDEQPFERCELAILLAKTLLAEASQLMKRDAQGAQQKISKSMELLADPLETNSRRLHGEALFLMGIAKGKLNGPAAGLLWLERAVPVIELYGGPILLASALHARGVVRARSFSAGAHDDLTQAQGILEAIGIQNPTNAQNITLQDMTNDFGEDEETLVGD
jgi:serine/threonine protein kinase